MMTSRGPSVIDWSAAARGDGNTDVALTWMLLSAGQIPGPKIKGAILGRFRSLLINSFIRNFDLEAVTPHLRAVLDWKSHDPHMSAIERKAMERFVSTSSGRRSRSRPRP
jgi:hypothetical protein